MLNLTFNNGTPPALNARNMNAIVESIRTLQTQVASPFNYKGVVSDVASLPATGNTVNDTYYVTAETCLYSWNGTAWSQSSMEESDYLAEITEVKNAFGSMDITKYLVSANGNYLAKSELNIDGHYFNTITGALATAENYRCGYIRYPKAGTYRLLQPKSMFGNNYLYIALYKGDKTYYRSIEGSSSDESVVVFTLTEEDVKNAPFIGVSMRKTNSVYPMLLLNKAYPSNYTYSPPLYDFQDLKGMRWMELCPNNLNNALVSGWYCNVHRDFTNVPSDYGTTSGCLVVLQSALNNNYSIQLLFDADTPPNTRIWYRYLSVDGSSASTWMLLPRRKEINDINSTLIIDRRNNLSKNISLSGNYFDWENAEWLDGFDNGTTIVTTSGYKHAFAPLQGPGDYIRVMQRSQFGTSCDYVCLFDNNKNRLKVINATRIGQSNGHAFTLSEEDAKTAAFITMNYREGSDYHYSGLYYNSAAYPMLAGTDCPLPNYKPSTLPIYKSVFVCDGDSIAAGVEDRPQYFKAWWGRIIADYSATGKNYSVGGGTITSELYYEDSSPRHWINESIDTIFSEYPELDYLILDGGTNDADLIGRFSGNTPPQNFGTWTDTDYSGNYNNETFCGAVETMFYKAVNHWPRAKIGFIIAMQMGRDNNTSANRRRYFDEIKKIAIKWHIPVLDLWEESQMDSRLVVYYDSSLTGDANVTAKKCYYDGQHPTSYGYDLMQGKIDAWVRSL